MSDKRPDCEKRTGEICEGFRGFMDRMYHDQRALSETLDERDDELTHLRAQLAMAREALEYYADESGEGRQFMVCHAVDREPVESVHDMGYRARRALAEIKEQDHDG